MMMTVRRWLLSSTANYFALVWLGASLVAPLPLTMYAYRHAIQPIFVADMQHTVCWLTSSHMYALLVGPVAVLLGATLLLYVIVLVRVLSMYNRVDEMVHVASSVSAYNERRVIALLTFSFVSLGLTWLLGVVVAAASSWSAAVAPGVRLTADLLFCLFNSFHGLSLLVGHHLARKYSRCSTSPHNTAAATTSRRLLASATSDECNINSQSSFLSSTLIACFGQRRSRSTTFGTLELKAPSLDESKFNTITTHVSPQHEHHQHDEHF